MGLTWKQRWRNLTKGEPGQRFQQRYEAARQARRSDSWGRRLTRLLRFIVALGAIVVGLVLAFIPGPAILFFILAGSLLAAESRGLARLLDWGEVRLRALWAWGKIRWAKLPGWGRVGLVLLLAGIGAASMYLSYRFLMN